MSDSSYKKAKKPYDYKHNIVEYLAERDVWIRPKTCFEKEPCYLCQEFNPWLNISGTLNYDYVYEQHPCEHRRNYCRTFDKLCPKYKEASKTFWSAERWRINNKLEYHHMNYNLWKQHMFDSSEQTRMDEDESREATEA
jgi:hypothetical protein